jgi:hypothetical protein
MPPYAVLCTFAGCRQPAKYKIAALWSDGVTQELKTYELCCDRCLPNAFALSRKKQTECHLAKHETLDAPGIYTLERGRRDAQIHRLQDLENQILQAPDSL